MDLDTSSSELDCFHFSPANGSGWSLNYTCLLYGSDVPDIPLTPFNSGFILTVKLSHFLHSRHLQSFIPLPHKNLFEIFHVPSSCFSNAQDVEIVVSYFLNHHGIPTTDQDSLVRVLFSFCQTELEASESGLVGFTLEFEIVTDVRSEAELVDWYYGGTMESVVVRTLRAAEPEIEGLEKTKYGGACSGREAARAVDECMVCLEDFQEGEEVTWLPCSHGYHENCIREWLTTNHRCPICRFPMGWVWVQEDRRIPFHIAQCALFVLS